MQDTTTPPSQPAPPPYYIPPAAPAPAAAPATRGTRTALKVALVGAGIVAGAIGATAIGASATTSGSGDTTIAAYSAASGTSGTSGTGSATAPTGAPTGAPGQGFGRGGPGGPGGQNPNETVIATTDSKYNTLVSAAKAAVSGATVDKVETDSGDAKYEVHMTKSDGSKVTVKFDANLKETAVEDGMGK
jgi:hypothetical protein